MKFDDWMVDLGYSGELDPPFARAAWAFHLGTSILHLETFAILHQVLAHLGT